MVKKETKSHQILEPEKLRIIRKQVKEDLAYIKAHYGVHPEMRRHLPTDEADITHLEKLNLLEAAASLRTLRQELGKYPQAFLTFCHLRQLRLVKALDAQEPYFQAEACLSGKIYHEDRTVYLATSGEGPYALKGTLHHELFHLSDIEQIQRNLQVGRFCDRQWAPVIYQRIYDSEWEELNPQGEKAYIGPAVFVHSVHRQENALEGFVLAIGKMDPWEDRATIAGALMADPKAAYEKAQQDKIVDAKLKRIMTFYKERSKGKMDESYFADLIAGKVTEGYWKQ